MDSRTANTSTEQQQQQKKKKKKKKKKKIGECAGAGIEPTQLLA